MSQLKLTKPAPEWNGTAVVDGEFKKISLADYRGKYLVLFFYSSDFTSACAREITAFSNMVDKFLDLDCEVVACSTDSHFSHLHWIKMLIEQGGLGSMNIPLLADRTHEISRAYGVLKEDEGLAFHGLFIIDVKGNLRKITVNDMPMGQSVDETLRLVQAFQITEKHGEGGLDILHQNVYNMPPQMMGNPTSVQQIQQQMAGMRFAGAPMGGMVQPVQWGQGC